MLTCSHSLYVILVYLLFLIDLYNFGFGFSSYFGYFSWVWENNILFAVKYVYQVTNIDSGFWVPAVSFKVPQNIFYFFVLEIYKIVKYYTAIYVIRSGKLPITAYTLYAYFTVNMSSGKWEKVL